MSASKKGPGDPISGIIRFFASTSLTVILVATLTVLSFLGVTGRWGFQDVYHATYFQVILGLLFTNLLVCTIDRLPGTVRRIRMDMGPMAPPPPRKADHTFRIKSENVEEVMERAAKSAFGKIGRTLSREMDLPVKKGKEGETQPGTSLVSFRSHGKLSLLGPHITHLGIMAIIIGGIIGGMSLSEGLIYLKPGEETDKVLTMQNQSGVPLGFTLHCNEFKVTYYDNSGMASDYLCDLSIKEAGKEVLRKTIEVNQPLYHNGYGFYQSSYGPMIKLTARSVADGSTVSADLRLWETWTMPDAETSFQVVDHEYRSFGMGRNMGPKTAVEKFSANAFVDRFFIFEMFPNFDTVREGKYQLKFRTLSGRHWTGIRVIKDPGLPAIWAGSALLVLGVSISFFVFHRRIWLVAKKDGGEVELSLTGRTKKAKGLFEKHIKQIADKLSREFGGT